MRKIRRFRHCGVREAKNEGQATQRVRERDRDRDRLLLCSFFRSFRRFSFRLRSGLCFLRFLRFLLSSSLALSLSLSLSLSFESPRRRDKRLRRFFLRRLCERESEDESDELADESLSLSRDESRSDFFLLALLDSLLALSSAAVAGSLLSHSWLALVLLTAGDWSGAEREEKAVPLSSAEKPEEPHLLNPHSRAERSET